MKKHFLFGATVVILAFFSAMWSAVSAQSRRLSGQDSIHATDGAYRDGLFLGKFDAQAGRNQRVCVGRWSLQSDRASFANGYKDGYEQVAIGVSENE